MARYAPLVASATRRMVLGGGIAALTAACTNRGVETASGAPALPLGVQLYSVASEARSDLGATLGKLAAIGFQTVELAGYISQTPQALRAALDRAGLRCTSAHVPANAQRAPGRNLEDNLDLLAADARIIGFDTVILPLFLPPSRLPLTLQPGEDAKAMVNRIVAGMTERDWYGFADYLNTKGANLKARGLRFGFHNHGSEFVTVGQRTALDLLVTETDPALVTFELDCGWAASAGIDPIAFLDKHRGRVSALHLKDVAKSNVPNLQLRMDEADLGDGIIDWSRLLQAARSAGIERLFIEQEPPYARPVLDTLARNVRYLRTIASRLR